MVAPPLLAPQRLDTLRRALDATMADEKLIAEAKASDLDIRPVTGEKIAALVQEKMSTPADIVAQSEETIALKIYDKKK
jgi:tripartite-type tricarboxylate transporter receptor subunit TctC